MIVTSMQRPPPESNRRLELMQLAGAGGRYPLVLASMMHYGYDSARQSGIPHGRGLRIPSTVHSTVTYPRSNLVGEGGTSATSSLYFPLTRLAAATAVASSPFLQYTPPAMFSVTGELVHSTGRGLNYVDSNRKPVPVRMSSSDEHAEEAVILLDPISHKQELQEQYDREDELPENFKPGPNSVIIGRKKNCYTSMGNLRLRDICLMQLPAYSKCGKKKDKSEIVTAIVKLIRDSCPKRRGAFVKRASNGRWLEVKDVVARERVASIFRDFLHEQYRSSSKSKVAKRREKRTAQFGKTTSPRHAKEKGDGDRERGEEEEGDSESDAMSKEGADDKSCNSSTQW